MSSLVDNHELSSSGRRCDSIGSGNASKCSRNLSLDQRVSSPPKTDNLSGKITRVSENDDVQQSKTVNLQLNQHKLTKEQEEGTTASNCPINNPSCGYNQKLNWNIVRTAKNENMSTLERSSTSNKNGPTTSENVGNQNTQHVPSIDSTWNDHLTESDWKDVAEEFYKLPVEDVDKELETRRAKRFVRYKSETDPEESESEKEMDDFNEVHNDIDVDDTTQSPTSNSIVADDQPGNYVSRNRTQNLNNDGMQLVALQQREVVRFGSKWTRTQVEEMRSDVKMKMENISYENKVIVFRMVQISLRRSRKRVPPILEMIDNNLTVENLPIKLLLEIHNFCELLTTKVDEARLFSIMILKSVEDMNIRRTDEKGVNDDVRRRLALFIERNTPKHSRLLKQLVTASRVISSIHNRTDQSQALDPIDISQLHTLEANLIIILFQFFVVLEINQPLAEKFVEQTVQQMRLATQIFAYNNAIQGAPHGVQSINEQSASNLSKKEIIPVTCGNEKRKLPENSPDCEMSLSDYRMKKMRNEPGTSSNF